MCNFILLYFCLFNYKSACKKEGNLGKFGLSLLVGVCFLRAFFFFQNKPNGHLPVYAGWHMPCVCEWP